MRIRKNTNVALQILAAAVELLDPSLVESTKCQLNQSPWDAISPAQLNQPDMVTDSGNQSLIPNKSLIPGSAVIQERGSSKENPIVIDEEDSHTVIVEEEKSTVIVEEEKSTVIVEEEKSEDVDVPLLVVFGNKRNTEKCYKNKFTPSPKDGNASCISERVKTKSVDLPVVKKIYKPRARKPALVFDENGYYYYSGFAPSKRGSTSKDDDDEKTRF